MNQTNPFQIPSCFQRADFQLRRRERFKKSVVLVVATVAAWMITLLIEGCVTEHSQATTASAPSALESLQLQDQPASGTVKPVAVTAAVPAPQPKAAPAATVKPAVINSVPAIYVVKRGDTLSRIARLHQTTVKALKLANGLSSDMIAVGAQLKLPPS